MLFIYLLNMLVTITTDASFYHEYKVGGYAFWITSQRGRKALAGAFKDDVVSSNDAEFKCVVNSLYQLKALGWEVTQIYVNTDSQAVMNSIEGRHDKLPEYAKATLKQYEDILVKLNNPVVSARHVKAHKHTKTARHWCNQWCDDNARKAAKNKIKKMGYK